MEIDLTPLGLSKEKERAFVHKRIREQNEYLQHLFTTSDSSRRQQLIADAKIIKDAFQNRLYLFHYND